MNTFSKLQKTFKMTAAGVALAVAGVMASAPADAGNIFLTGHDDDLHGFSLATQATQQIAAALNFVRAGSTLPVLTFDAGTQLTNNLTLLGIAFTNVNPTAANVTDALFNPSLYSAFAVASVTTCGGCDNPVGTGGILATHSAAIASFFNAGRGILGLAGATDLNAYAYVPTSATNAGGSPPSTGYVQTALGVTLGIPAVNGNATHNFFSEPGTGGLSPLYQVVERLGNAVTGTPESIVLIGGTIVCPPGTTGAGCTIIVDGRVPEPGTLGLIGLALAGMGGLRRRIRKNT